MFFKPSLEDKTSESSQTVTIETESESQVVEETESETQSALSARVAHLDETVCEERTEREIEDEGLCSNPDFNTSESGMAKVEPHRTESPGSPPPRLDKTEPGAVFSERDD